MRLAILTSLYPSAVRPVEGIFAERRWTKMRARGHEVSVTQPLPLASRWLPLARWRAQASVPSRERRSEIEIERPRYLHVPGRARGNAAAFARAGVRALGRRERPDAVVLDYAWPAVAAVPALRALGLPCVVSGRGSDVLEVAGEAGLADELAFGLRSAGHWCGVSQDLVTTMDRLAGAPGRGVLVPNGVDATLFRPRSRAEAREALDVPQGGRYVLVCGHLIERKDPLLALEVFARAQLGDAFIVFVGEGPLLGALEAAVRALEMEERVMIHGVQSPERLAQWYAASDVLLLTSRREGRPNVVLEALASGRPVLATDVGGTRELLGAHAERMLARTRDPAQLGRRLAELLATPFDPAALAASVAHLSWDASLDALEGCIGRAVAEAR